MNKDNSCCAPQRTEKTSINDRSTGKTSSVNTEKAELAGGPFRLGSNYELAYPQDGEEFTTEVFLSPFLIDKYSVTNQKFMTFVDDTGYVTEAEEIGWSFVFGGLLPDDFEDTRGVQGAPWWRQVFGATWKSPEGPQSTIEGKLNHPVVQISWNDAVSYANWCGGRLPTEAEWEYAAAAGSSETIFPWGNQLTPDGEHQMNVWQGSFPDKNLEDDGWYGTAPVGSYPPNKFDLYEMTGNTWEWCQDWFTNKRKPRLENPTGPPTGTNKVIKGGSYLCHESYCNRYRPAARSSTTPTSTMGHLGFRLAYDRE